MVFFLVPVLALASLVSLWLLRWLVRPVLDSRSDPPAASYRHEVVDPADGSSRPFPKLSDEASVTVTFVMPAYNEEERMHTTMQSTMAYLEGRHRADKAFTYEVVIVDDGSRDRTAEVAQGYAGKYGVDRVRLLRLPENQGKGGAVQQGMLHSRGELLLMMDADGATDLDEYTKIERRLKEIVSGGHGVAVGSRAHLEEQATAERKWYRNILGYGFNFLVKTLCVKTVRDTQCGFKLFTRRTARALFTTQHLRRWSFDVELLFVAEQLGIPITEVAVRWEEIPGSKLDLIASMFQMGRDLLVIRLAYSLGLWKIAVGKKDM